MIQSNLQRLLHECATSNDDRAWDEFLERYGQALRSGIRLALSRVGAAADDERIEEMTQEALCRLLDRGRRMLTECQARTDGELVNYLRRLGETTTLSYLRRDGAAKRGGYRLQRQEAATACERLVDPAPPAEERMHTAQLRARFRRSCLRLCEGSRRNRRILEAAFLDGWTSREIVRFLARDLKPPSVDSLLHRMRRRFLDEGLELPGRRTA